MGEAKGGGGGGFIMKEPEESRLTPRNVHTRSLPLFRKNRERPIKCFNVSSRKFHMVDTHHINRAVFT